MDIETNSLLGLTSASIGQVPIFKKLASTCAYEIISNRNGQFWVFWLLKGIYQIETEYLIYHGDFDS